MKQFLIVAIQCLIIGALFVSPFIRLHARIIMNIYQQCKNTRIHFSLMREMCFPFVRK